MPIQPLSFDYGNDYSYGATPNYEPFHNNEDIAKLVSALFGYFGPKNNSIGAQPVGQLAGIGAKAASNYPQGPENTRPEIRSQGGRGLMDLIRKRESGGNYKAQNTLGFLGGYQFGAPALEAIHYLKKGAGKLGNKALSNPQNWLIPGGKEAFLGNKNLQDKAFQILTKLHENQLKKMGLITSQTDARTKNAMLAAAHLGGPGGVKELLKGRNRKDAYGTGIREYFNLGLKA